MLIGVQYAGSQSPGGTSGRVTRSGKLSETGLTAPRSSALDAWRAALAQVPTLFGRLVYVASLRDLSSGRYVDPGIIQVLGNEETDQFLRQVHRQLFQQWLNSNLTEQKADLDEYWSAGTGMFLISELRELVPRSAREVERQLYLTDLETLLELWKAERSVFPAPEASPLQ